MPVEVGKLTKWLFSLIVCAVCHHKHSRLKITIEQLQKQRGELELIDLSSQAACVVAMHALPSKVTPVIKTILKAVKAEENERLQKRACVHWVPYGG